MKFILFGGKSFPKLNVVKSHIDTKRKIKLPGFYQKRLKEIIGGVYSRIHTVSRPQVRKVDHIYVNDLSLT